MPAFVMKRRNGVYVFNGALSFINEIISPWHFPSKCLFRSSLLRRFFIQHYYWFRCTGASGTDANF